MDLVQHLARLLEGVPRLLREAVGQVGLDAAHAPVGDREPGPRDLLDQLPQELAGLDHVQEDREGPQLHGRGADAREMVAHPRDLAHDHADVLAPLRDVDAEQLLDGRGVAEVVDERRDVVQPVRVRDGVVVAADLAVLLEGAMEIADLDVGLADDLSVELGQDADDPVHRRMRGPDADGEVRVAAAGPRPLAEHELPTRR
jgi:hypothetical protein